MSQVIRTITASAQWKPKPLAEVPAVNRICSTSTRWEPIRHEKYASTISKVIDYRKESKKKDDGLPQTLSTYQAKNSFRLSGYRKSDCKSYIPKNEFIK